jgi:hypothetical protein
MLPQGSAERAERNWYVFARRNRASARENHNNNDGKRQKHKKQQQQQQQQQHTGSVCGPIQLLKPFMYVGVQTAAPSCPPSSPASNSKSNSSTTSNNDQHPRFSAEETIS